MFLLLLACGPAGPDKADDTADSPETADSADTGDTAAWADADSDGIPASEDCDDADADIGAATTWYGDGDRDGYGVASVSIESCTSGGAFVALSGDCDDGDPAIHPGATEVCNGADDDCDGGTDINAADPLPWYADDDGDTYGDATRTEAACTPPTGYVADATDCDDTTADIHPGAPELCDELDRDCDGSTTDGAIDMGTWYTDVDLDTYGAPDTGVVACTAPAGTVPDGTDCDDARAETFPGAPEYCNGVDDNCDGTVDEPEALDAHDSFEDSDADGYGNSAAMATGCEELEGFSRTGGDCHDGDATVYPGAPETCDGVDEDCDAIIDNDPVDPPTWYADADGDGYGDATTTLSACAAPPGYLADDQDCDDADPTRALTCDSTSPSCTTLTPYPGDVHQTGFGSATALSSFCVTYNAIDGNLRLSNTDLTDLSVLSCLCTVGGDVLLDHNRTLTSMAGAEHLASIGGDLVFSGNTALTTLAGLDALTSVAGTLSLDSRTPLTDLTGLGGLTDVGGITLANTSLQTLDGLEALTTIDRTLSMSSNRNLTSLTGLSGLQTVGGSVELSSHPRVTTLSGLDALTTIEGALVLMEMDGLTDMTGLGGLVSIGDDFTVIGANLQTSFAGLASLTTVHGTLTWYSNTLLSSTDGLQGVTSLGGLTIDSNAPSSYDLTGLSALTEITGNIYVNLPVVWTFEGLDALTSIGGAVGVYNVASGSSFAGLGNVTVVDGSLNASGIPDYNGFDSLTTIGGWVPGLTNEFLGLEHVTTVGSVSCFGECTGLEAVSSIGQLLYVSNGGASALSALRTVGGDVTFFAPSNADGLDTLESIGGDLRFLAYDYYGDYGTTTSTINGFNRLRTVDGDLTFGLPDLGTVSGLSALETVGGILTASGCGDINGYPGLTNLTEVGGLSLSVMSGMYTLGWATGLTGINGSLNISGNYQLGDLTGLYNVAYVTGDFTISDNDRISTAQARALRDDIGVANIGGTITFTE